MEGIDSLGISADQIMMLKGEPGAPGPVGPVGPQGDTGAQGYDGIEGRQGDPGMKVNTKGIAGFTQPRSHSLAEHCTSRAKPERLGGRERPVCPVSPGRRAARATGAAAAAAAGWAASCRP